MKIFLLQLPIQGHDFFFSRENIPLAAAYLKALGTKKGLQVDLLPKPLMRYGSDQAILRFLVDQKPDLVGMSCYLWNVERNLFLAGELKRRLPECRIVMGGPEVTPDNEFLLQSSDFDLGVMGEGEGIWDRLLDVFPQVPDIPGLLHRGEDGRLHRSRGRIRSLPLDRLTSPYLAGCLDSHLDELLWLESVRGCVHRCAYCYYQKQFARVKPFPLERIAGEVGRAWKRGLREIVFLDPCFVRRPGLEELLQVLIEINRDRRLRFSGECNVEEITASLAKKLWEAGFTGMEVGLQSVNRDTLRRIHRRFHPGRFIDGVRHLQAKGVNVMVDLIAGLPGDGFSDICGSLDWVLSGEAYDFLMLYPLSLLPATELRQRAGEMGLSFMPHPPYLVTGGPAISAQEISLAFHYYEKRMEQDISPLEMPPALATGSGDVRVPAPFRHAVQWQNPGEVTELSGLEASLAYAFTVILSKQVLRQPDRFVPVLRDYLKRNPFSLLSVEVPPEAYPEELEPLWKLAAGRSHPNDRDYTVTHTPYRSILLFSRKDSLLWKWPDPREDRPIVLPDGGQVSSHSVCVVEGIEEAAPAWFVDHLAKRYSPLPKIRPWQPPGDEP